MAGKAFNSVKNAKLLRSSTTAMLIHSHVHALACAELSHPYVLTTTIFNIYSFGCTYLNIFWIEKMLLCTDRFSRTFLTLALQTSFLQNKTCYFTCLYFNTSLFRSVFFFLYQRLFCLWVVENSFLTYSLLRECKWSSNEGINSRLETSFW